MFKLNTLYYRENIYPVLVNSCSRSAARIYLSQANAASTLAFLSDTDRVIEANVAVVREREMRAISCNTAQCARTGTVTRATAVQNEFQVIQRLDGNLATLKLRRRDAVRSVPSNLLYSILNR